MDGPSRSPGIELEPFMALAPIARPPHPPAVTAAPSGPVRVGGDVQMAKLVKKVIPEYPPLAKAARVSGVVRLLGIIAKDGTIQNLQLISGHPLLARAALDAVKQWISTYAAEWPAGGSNCAHRCQFHTGSIGRDLRIPRLCKKLIAK
jgi:TonB family protein